MNRNATTAIRRSLILPMCAAAAIAAATAIGPQSAAADMRLGSGESITASQITGQPVMLQGTRIGRVQGPLNSADQPNNVLIEVDEEHSQMGGVVGSAEMLPSNTPPVIVGGRTIAVPASALRSAPGGGFDLSADAVTTLEDFARLTAPMAPSATR